MESPLFRPAAITAAACTIVQACVWAVLSLLGLLAAVEVLGPTTAEDYKKYISSTGVFELEIIECYFPREIKGIDTKCCVEGLILPGDAMLAVSIVYLVGSIVWLCVSSTFLFKLLKKGAQVAQLTLGWVVLTCIICLLDFVIAILFGIDYSKMTTNMNCGGGYLAVPGLLMSIAARGYVLWLLNVVCAVLLGRAASKGLSSSRRSSNSSGSSMYHNPTTPVEDSRSMVFQNTDRPWVTGGDTQRSQPFPRAGVPYQQPQSAWDRPDSGGQPNQQYPGNQQYPSNRQPHGSQQRPPSEPPRQGYYPETQRGGLAARMGQGPSSNVGSQRGSPPSPPRQQQQPPRSHIPEPDYDANNSANAPRRSVLKKSPSSAAPPANDWRQQGNTGRQTPQSLPMSPDGRGGWQPSSSADNRSRQGYDNRGYDNRGNDLRGQNNWQGDNRGSGGRWGSTGF